MNTGCRSCTDTYRCRSCKRRAPSLPPADMATMNTTYEFVSTANTAAISAIADACNGIVWVDDAQVVELHVSKRYSSAPGVMVEVRPA